MTKKLKLQVRDDQQLEILKAVAQAWYGHSARSRSTNEFDAHRQNFKSQPSRFKLQAMNKLKETASANWDFGQSLCDSYEIVTISKRLEAGLVVNNPFSQIEHDAGLARKRRRESKNRLRNLFNRMFSRRYNESEVPEDDGTQF